MVYRLFVLKFRKILIKIFCGSVHLIRFQVFKLQHYQKDTQQRLFFWRFSEMFRISTIKIKPTNCSFSKNTFDKSYEILILMKENISTNNCRQKGDISKIFPKDIWLNTWTDIFRYIMSQHVMPFKPTRWGSFIQ